MGKTRLLREVVTRFAEGRCAALWSPVIEDPAVPVVTTYASVRGQAATRAYWRYKPQTCSSFLTIPWPSARTTLPSGASADEAIRISL